MFSMLSLITKKFTAKSEFNEDVVDLFNKI